MPGGASQHLDGLQDGGMRKYVEARFLLIELAPLVVIAQGITLGTPRDIPIYPVLAKVHILGHLNNPSTAGQ